MYREVDSVNELLMKKLHSALNRNLTDYYYPILTQSMMTVVQW